MVDPLQSPRVLRAVLDEVIAQMSDYILGEKATPNTLYLAQNLLDHVLHDVHFRGTRILKLISINVTEKDGALTVHFKPMSEDGEWLLSRMHVTKPIQDVRFEAMTQPVAITRVIEL
jgi:hypothetical protein